MKIYLDGKFVDEADAKISVFDHGLLYGDGIFEGISLYEGNIFRLDQHLKRLANSAKAIMLDLPCPPEEIGEIMGSVHIRHIYLEILNGLAHEEVTALDVLDLLMVFRVV